MRRSVLMELAWEIVSQVSPCWDTEILPWHVGVGIADVDPAGPLEVGVAVGRAL